MGFFSPTVSTSRTVSTGFTTTALLPGALQARPTLPSAREGRRKTFSQIQLLILVPYTLFLFSRPASLTIHQLLVLPVLMLFFSPMKEVVIQAINFPNFSNKGKKKERWPQARISVVSEHDLDFVQQIAEQ